MEQSVPQNPNAAASVIVNPADPSPGWRHSGASHIDSPVLSHLQVAAGRWTGGHRTRIQATVAKIWTSTERTNKGKPKSVTCYITPV
jgi:hypothetical protein